MATGAAGRLWRRAPAWRVLVGAAALVSLAAVVVRLDLSTLTRGAGGQSAAMQGAQGTTTATAPAPALPAGCQPAGGAPVQTPTPGNATVFAPAIGHSPETLGRVQDFASRIDAAAGVGQLGMRCERIAGAATALQPEDLAYIRCDTDLADKLSAARKCDGDIADSDARRARLAAALSAWRAERTAPAAAEIAAAGAALDTAFDRSRAPSGAVDQALREADDARAILAASDARLKALGAASVLAPDSAAPPGALRALADVARTLTAFDRQRMTQDDRAAADRGAAAAAAIAEADARFADLDAALALSRTAGGDAVAQALLAAVDALTPQDMRWSAPERDAAIAQARAAAAGYALTRLEAATASYEEGSEGVEAADELRRLLAAVEANGTPAALTDAQRRALNVARAAAARLTQSDRRLAVARSAASRWKANPSADLGDDVKAARLSLTEFDLKRATSEDRTAVATLDQALDVLRASVAGEWRWSNRADVAVNIRPLGGEAELAAAAEALRGELDRRGFAIAAAPDGSAIDLALRWMGTEESQVSVGGTTIRSVAATVGAEAVWSFTGKTALSVVATGDQAGGHGPGERQEAARRAARRIADAIEKHVRADGP